MDKEIIEKRLMYINEKLKDLKYDLEKYNKVENEKDKKTIQGAIERWCEEIVESGVNINIELLSSKNKISDSYYNSFIDLKIFNYFDEDFLTKIASTAGFRNRLAHDYMNIDKEIMIGSAKFILKLYKDYILNISSFLKKI
ncbi:MAG: type VII toxin-antitoxin system HepT family RNase toxin [Nanoarchaeota archaeon]